MQKKLGWIALLVSLLLAFAAQAEDVPVDSAEPAEFSLDDLYLTTVFPDGWTVVTPDTVADFMRYSDEATPANAAETLRAEGVYAVAFSEAGDAMLRILAEPGDETAALYYDIERYTPAMRSDIRAGFLDKEAWSLTGYRYTEAEWTNKANQGRLLRLTYSVRSGEETIARGLQAYTIRNGMAFTLDLRVNGRRASTAEQRIFEDFMNATIFPASSNMPLLPVGLTVTDGLPEETHKAELTVRGQTMKDATVTAWLLPADGEAIELGHAAAAASGVFKMDIVLPEQGEFRLYLVASLEGYADSEIGGWINYNARRIPVTFTSLPAGLYQESQVIIAGKTIPGVTIQCMEGDTNKKVITGSNGEFSFKMDRTLIGERTVVLSMTKDKFDNRRFDISFDRQWKMEDYVKYLSDKTKNLSYASLTERADEFVGRLVQYSGRVLDVSFANDRVYVQFALTKTKSGAWTNQIVAFADEMEVPLAPNDAATLFVEVTAETYAFSELNEDGDEIDMDLPAVKLIAYQKN